MPPGEIAERVPHLALKEIARIDGPVWFGQTCIGCSEKIVIPTKVNRNIGQFAQASGAGLIYGVVASAKKRIVNKQNWTHVFFTEGLQEGVARQFFIFFVKPLQLPRHRHTIPDHPHLLSLPMAGGRCDEWFRLPQRVDSVVQSEKRY
jgi:hypothetical protein